MVRGLSLPPKYIVGLDLLVDVLRHEERKEGGFL